MAANLFLFCVGIGLVNHGWAVTGFLVILCALTMD